MIKEFMEFMDRHFIVRRACVVSSLILTFMCFLWAMRYADAHPDPGLAAIIGAILVPISAFQAAVFKFYSDARDVTQKDEQS